MKNKIIYIVSVILSLFVGICGTLVVVYYIPDDNIKIQEKVIKEDVTINVTDTIAPIVDLVYDSVVTVSNYSKSTLASIGTGFVYKTDDNYGYILTNNHVVEKATTLKVTNTQDTTVEATLLGSDEYADLAVLRVDKSFILQVAKLGNSTNLSVGDSVFAIGTPVSVTYANSVTKGIISGKNRTVSTTLSDGTQFMMEVLQTNAAINPGNSGGPLVNMNGEVVGINTLKLVKDEIEGMGFSIPIEMATSILDRLEKGEKIKRPLIGVEIIEANNTYALFKYQVYLDKAYDKGLVIINITEDSSAQKAGLQKKDILLKVDGVTIENSAHFKYLLYKYSIGDIVKLEIERNGEVKTIDLTLDNAI